MLIESVIKAVAVSVATTVAVVVTRTAIGYVERKITA